MNTLKLGSLVIPLRAGLDIEQTYTLIGGETTLRTIDGTGIKQETWKKLRTTISGSGWLPAGISALDTTASMAVACITPQGIVADASRQAILPAARRSDAGHTPWAFALLPHGELANTPMTLVGNLATADAYAGAEGYLIQYYPQPTCWVQRPVESGNRADATYRWEITAEEV